MRFVLLIAVIGCGSSTTPESRPSVSRKNTETPVEAANAPITNSIGMKLQLIPSGEFQMGSVASAEELAEQFDVKVAVSQFAGEQPRHHVRITQAFYLGQHEVTVGQFRKFVDATEYRTEAESEDDVGGQGFDEASMDLIADLKYTWENPGFPQDENHPVVNVSWNDAMAFCSWLSRKEEVEYRLPTEAEWEYACRAGSTTLYHNGDELNALVSIANVCDRRIHEYMSMPWIGKAEVTADDSYVFTSPVGNFRANQFGLYDMHGNVYEWCQDWFGDYPSGLVTDPAGPASGQERVNRGGGWFGLAAFCRSADRGKSKPWNRLSFLGFRVARKF